MLRFLAAATCFSATPHRATTPKPLPASRPMTASCPSFEGLGVSVVVCGHTHMQFDRMVGTTRVVNAGSVGMPFGEPGADWLLLNPDVQLPQSNGRQGSRPGPASASSPNYEP